MSALDKKISALTEATTLSVGDFFAVVQAGETKKVNFSNLFSNQNTTLANIQTAITNGTLVSGSVYYLANAQVTQAETIPAKILIQAVSNNQISPNAIRFQLVPDYTALNFWDNGGTYNIGDKVIWGSRVWENVNGNVGTAPDPLTLNNEWDEVPYVAGTDYTELAMCCQYDIVNDIIYKQEYKGVTLETTLQSIIDSGLSGLDFCDWGQIDTMDYHAGVKLFAFGILNNTGLNVFFNVEAVGIVNNFCATIANVKAQTDKITSGGGSFSIYNNRCQNIKDITNIRTIRDIPQSVNTYSFVTDDETGYLEFDFDADPLAIGTYVIGCILPQSVSICEVIMNTDGLLPATTDFTFGIDTDDPTYVTYTGATLNGNAQRDTTISLRTTAYNRELILDIATANANSGKLWITYKYV